MLLQMVEMATLILVAAAKNFDQIRSSFKGVYKDLQEEQSSKVRGGIGMAYDQ